MSVGIGLRHDGTFGVHHSDTHFHLDIGSGTAGPVSHRARDRDGAAHCEHIAVDIGVESEQVGDTARKTDSVGQVAAVHYNARVVVEFRRCRVERHNHDTAVHVVPSGCCAI